MKHTLYASGRGGPCFYCTKEGHFLRNCRGSPPDCPGPPRLSRTKGPRRDERRWKDQQPTRQEWVKGRHKEEWGPPPPPPKGNRREPWRDESGREGGPRRDQRGGATQALEEEDGGDTAPEMNVLCEVDSIGEEGLFGLREVGDISDEEAAAAFSSDEEEEEGEGARDVGVSTCWPPPVTSAPGPPMCGAAWAPKRSMSRS